jgi:DNA repair protein RecO (recombination protein O)
MGLVTTQAVVLHAFPYSESSKIVRLATQRFGVQSALAKGARRRRSGVGAHIEPFTEGRVHLYMREHRDLHTLGSFDVERERFGLARPLSRYAAASALTELQLRCAPPAALPVAYDVLCSHLDRLTAVAEPEIEAAGLQALWQLVGALGFAPSLDACVIDSEPVEGDGRVAFSLAEGGVLCRRCGQHRDVVSLAATDLAALRSFTHGADPLPTLTSRHAAAHRRLISRFIHTHLAEGRPLPALGFWERHA